MQYECAIDSEPRSGIAFSFDIGTKADAGKDSQSASNSSHVELYIRYRGHLRYVWYEVKSNTVIQTLPKPRVAQYYPKLRMKTFIKCSIRRITVRPAVRSQASKQAQTRVSFLPRPRQTRMWGRRVRRIDACEYAATLRLVILLEAAATKHRGIPAAGLKKRLCTA